MMKQARQAFPVSRSCTLGIERAYTRIQGICGFPLRPVPAQDAFSGRENCVQGCHTRNIPFFFAPVDRYYARPGVKRMLF